MVKINEYERTATFSWSHDPLPVLATASAAGAVDMDFSSSSKLEIFDVFSLDSKTLKVELDFDTKFYGLDWSNKTSAHSNGLLAGALENGIVQLWDAAKLLKGDSLDLATFAKGSKHTGPVKTVKFNPTQENILASAGSKGELFIWDTVKFDDPTTPGKAMTPMEDITCVSWNHNVKHVFASAGSTGYTSIWDLRAKKEVLHLTYTGTTGRCNLSTVCWNPAESTHLLTASDNDNAPYILAWNLRNPKEPEKILEGHTKGVLSMDWCTQDNELLLTGGKDNTTILWDPIHGVKLGSYPTTANWVFETKFAPSLPEVFATSSFDGKVVVQTLQDTSPPITETVSKNETNNEDFWGNLASTETQQPEFTTSKAPKWLKRPTSVSFGFGGKLVHVTSTKNVSTVDINKFKGDEKLSQDVKLLSDSISSKNFKEIVEGKVESSTDNAKSDWKLLQNLLEKDKLQLLKEQLSNDEAPEAGEETKESVAEPGEDGFFEKLGQELDILFEPPTNSFQLFADDEESVESQLKTLILAGKFSDAVDLCLKEDRLTDALIILLNGEDSLKEKVKNAYFTKSIPKSTFSRVLYSVSSNDVTDLVNNADIKNWKEIASGISTFTKDPQAFASKILELGDRILASDSKTARDDALICFAAGGAIDRISNIWLKEVSENEKELLENSDNSMTLSDAHFKALSQFVEKITIYRAASGITGEFSGPGIEKLCNAFLEYSTIISNLGEFELASEFLQLLPSSSEQLKIEKDRVLKASNKTVPVATTTTKRPSAYGSTLSPYGASQANIAPVPSNPGYIQPSNGGYTPQLSSGNNPYAAAAQAAQAAAQVVPTPPIRAPNLNPYAPTTALDSLRRPSTEYQAPTYGASGLPSAPTGVQLPPAKNPATFNRDVGGWNDLPNHLGVKNSRGTSSPSPYANVASAAALLQQRPDMPSRLTSFGAAPPQAQAPPPPPPAGSTSATPSVSGVGGSALSSPQAKPLSLSRPSKYAPPPSFTAIPSLPVGNGLVPPPSSNNVTPPSNPYAPKPQLAQAKSNPYAPPPMSVNGNGSGSYSAPPPALNNYLAPPPPPLGNAYAPPPHLNNSYAPPPPALANSFAPPPAAAVASPPPPPPLAPVKPHHPTGDRSHIPSEQLPIFEILSSTLQLTASKMPEKYHKQVADTEKRLNILFEHLNNEELSGEITGKLVSVVNSVQSGDYAQAGALQSQVALDHPTECGQWMVGLKRLIQMTDAANR